MSARDFDDSALMNAWSPGRIPAAFNRQMRVRLLGGAFSALLRGEMPTDEQRLFLAGGGLAWLEQGGDLLGDYWKVRSCRGSHLTPSAVWQSLHRDEEHDSRDLFKSTA